MIDVIIDRAKQLEVDEIKTSYEIAFKLQKAKGFKAKFESLNGREIFGDVEGIIIVACDNFSDDRRVEFVKDNTIVDFIIMSRLNGID